MIPSSNLSCFSTCCCLFSFDSWSLLIFYSISYFFLFYLSILFSYSCFFVTYSFSCSFLSSICFLSCRLICNSLFVLAISFMNISCCYSDSYPFDPLVFSVSCSRVDSRPASLLSKFLFNSIIYVFLTVYIFQIDFLPYDFLGLYGLLTFPDVIFAILDALLYFISLLLDCLLGQCQSRRVSLHECLHIHLHIRRLSFIHE